MVNKSLKQMSLDELLNLYKENKRKIQQLCKEKEELKLNMGVIPEK